MRFSIPATPFLRYQNFHFSTSPLVLIFLDSLNESAFARSRACLSALEGRRRRVERDSAADICDRSSIERTSLKKKGRRRCFRNSFFANVPPPSFSFNEEILEVE